MAKDITSMRSTLEFLKEKGELLTIEKEVDPILEITGIQVALEEGPGLLFENIKGYPHARYTANAYAREDNVAAIYDVAEYKDLKFKFLKGMENQIPPRVVEQAPCQEVVITDNIDVPATLPLLKHTEESPERLLGGGVTLTRGLPGQRGSDLSFKRMSFRGKDWSSISIAPESHLGYLRNIVHGDEKVPLTVNICPPPAVMCEASAWSVHAVVPYGTDELGIAGAMQGSPIDICKAKTVDAYAAANAEWVLEGYVTTERCWETDDAEKLNQEHAVPFFPEWHGYLGRAHHKSFKFQVTAITHRKDRPIFHNPLSGLFDCNNMMFFPREAYFYQLAQQTAPGLVQDIGMLHPFRLGGVIFQVKKTLPWHETIVPNILSAALALGRGGMAIAVDEDIDLHCTDDVLWAIWTRGNQENNMFRGPGRPGRARAPLPAIISSHLSGLAIDATLPFGQKDRFKRSHYPVDKIKLSKWFSEAELEAVRKSQSRYAKLLARIGG